MSSKRERETVAMFAQAGKDNGYEYKDVELLFLLALHCDDWEEKLVRMTEQIANKVSTKQMAKEILRDIPWENIKQAINLDNLR
ncbi:MAG: hypothetical protein NC350_05250 [Corallococcus sp.]|nr:hypothetical protein [Corallococcus sp.]